MSTLRAPAPTTGSSISVVRPRSGQLDVLNGRFLVVDADRDTRRVVRRVLTSAGAFVDTASTERRALELFAEHDYRVVITDVALPKSSGFEFVQACQRHDKPSMFVLISASKELEIPPMPGCEDAIVGIVHKPLDASELLDAARSASEVHRSRAPGAAHPSLDAPVLLLLQPGETTDVIRRCANAVASLDGVFETSRLREALEVLSDRQFGIAVADMRLRDAIGLDAVRRLKAADADLAIVVVAEPGSDIAEQALSMGAQEIVPLTASDDDVRLALRRALLRKQADREVRHQATHDALTGLQNNARFQEQLKEAVARSRRNGSSFALMYIDLDLFKPINDTHGHAAGDVVLHAIAKRLLEATRESDACARLGGDEFAILLDGAMDRAEVRIVAQRVLRLLSAPIQIDSKTRVQVTASIGVAIFPHAAETAAELVDAADTAMFEAKESGRSQCCIAADAGFRHAGEESHATAELMEASAQGDFYMVYQPQVDMNTHGVICLEALLRWRRRKGPPCGPDHFVPMLEDSGLIREVGAFALSEACSHAAQWERHHGRKVRVAVNVSPLQLEDGRFTALAMRMLHEHRLSPRQLELEITETTVMRDSSTIRDNLATLRAQGVRIVLDDFGTGYASLAYLLRHTFQGVKIDRSFVAPLATDQNARVLVGAIIELAHQLGMEVVAEGVENMSQVSYLRERGCDACQGFLFGRPHFPGRTDSVPPLASA